MKLTEKQAKDLYTYGVLESYGQIGVEEDPDCKVIFKSIPDATDKYPSGFVVFEHNGRYYSYNFHEYSYYESVACSGYDPCIEVECRERIIVEKYFVKSGTDEEIYY